MTEQREDRRVSRRTITKGTAWSVPVVAVMGSASAQAQAVSGCVPSFTPIAGSTKCCNGQIKNMKLVLKVTDDTDCVDADSEICIISVLPSTGGTVGATTFDPIGGCVNEDDEVTVYLYDVSDCTVNLTVTYTIGGGDELTTPLKSGNVASGNTAGACEDPR